MSEEKGRFFKKVHYICRRIPKGKVATYGQIAVMAGNPRMARQVGWALHSAPSADPMPAHRVVNREGYLSGAGAFATENRQEQLLKKEGVVVKDRRLDLDIYGWHPDYDELEQISKALKTLE